MYAIFQLIEMNGTSFSSTRFGDVSHLTLRDKIFKELVGASASIHIQDTQKTQISVDFRVQSELECVDFSVFFPRYSLDNKKKRRKKSWKREKYGEEESSTAQKRENSSIEVSANFFFLHHHRKCRGGKDSAEKWEKDNCESRKRTIIIPNVSLRPVIASSSLPQLNSNCNHQSSSCPSVLPSHQSTFWSPFDLSFSNFQHAPSNSLNSYRACSVHSRILLMPGETDPARFAL